MKKSIISIFLFLFFIVNINASETNLSSQRYILYNLNDNEVIDAKKEHERVSIASLTKIMTVIVAIENIKDYNAKVKITSPMVDTIAWDVVKAGFKKGQVVTYNDLLYGAILPSGADAVNALAISISGSEAKFVSLMNKKVKELGLKDTSFSNVVGLYGKNNYSSAYDMAKILMYALKNEKFKIVFETKQYKLSTGKVVNSTLSYYNTKLNKDISFIKGAKTGYIEEALYCLASTASLDGVDYLFVSLNAKTNTDHINDHITEYKYFSSNYGYKNVVSKTDKMLTLKVKYSKEKVVNIYPNIEIEKYLKNDFTKEDLVYSYDGIYESSYFDNPFYLGNMSVSYNDKLMGKLELYNEKELHFDYIEFFKDKKIYFDLFLLILLIIAYIVDVKTEKTYNLKVDNDVIKS